MHCRWCGGGGVGGELALVHTPRSKTLSYNYHLVRMMAPRAKQQENLCEQ
jgi:hypothetical protein